MNTLSVLEKVASNRGVLLRCSGKARTMNCERLRFTFDIGIVEPRAEGSRLTFEAFSAESGSAGLTVWDEEQPWWKVLGHPLVRVEKQGNGCVHLQWRHNDDNPKIIELFAREDCVVVREIS